MTHSIVVELGLPAAVYLWQQLSSKSFKLHSEIWDDTGGYVARDLIHVFSITVNASVALWFPLGVLCTRETVLLEQPLHW
jgi:hypothetical protein